MICKGRVCPRGGCGGWPGLGGQSGRVIVVGDLITAPPGFWSYFRPYLSDKKLVPKYFQSNPAFPHRTLFPENLPTYLNAQKTAASTGLTGFLNT